MHISKCTYNNDADLGQDHGIQKMIFFICDCGVTRDTLLEKTHVLYSSFRETENKVKMPLKYS